ncbi:putative damage-inducible protein DinB [Tenacibaculum gallaicum]|uniref:Putative damage-inducible protein DinB n=1 Tax=Tenacibaculum gallaicum TaxID=561505 RepID=A0A3E0HWM7_9FLAO|nr:DinB family protein [Tenacibaculum gallaicum]REH50656.1 putative damage-inducible protein DinB [Tenacibaculum gallaicum]
MIAAINKNLQRGIKLLEAINDEQYSDTSIPPYYSSIGANMRHILDVFVCIFNGLDKKCVDFSDRERNQLAEQKTEFGIAYFKEVIEQLYCLETEDFDTIISVTDDLGTGKVTANYTLGSALIQAHSHAIHHFASIGFIINQLGIELPDADFGYNPTTPKKELVR